MTRGSGRSARKKWAKHLGSATLVAGALATGQPAAAHPVISDILNRAMARAATALTRREDVEMPAALVLAPASHGAEIILAGHSSHKSHSSHRSATTRAPKDARAKSKTNTSDKPGTTRHNSRQTIATVRSGDSLIKLRDGSRLVGRTAANDDGVTVMCKCLSLGIGKEDIASTLPAPIAIDLEKLTSGRCIVQFSNGNELRTDVVEHESTISLIAGARKSSVSKSRVSKLIHLGEPTEKWEEKEAGYCVVTLRDGSILRGKVWKEEGGDRYMFQNRYGTMRLATGSIFCFEKVEKVSRNYKKRAGPPTETDIQHTENANDAQQD